MSFTLATLKSTVQDYMETAETTFVSELDTFIQEAEERILKTVELPVFRKTSPEHLLKVILTYLPPMIFSSVQSCRNF